MEDAGKKNHLAQILQQTFSANTSVMATAEQQLRALEVSPGFAVLLLLTVRDVNFPPAVRQAGAIYFKNFIHRQWAFETHTPSGGVPAADKQAVKQLLFPTVLGSTKPVQVQILAGLQEISVSDYPEEWTELLPAIVHELKTSQKMEDLKSTMQTANVVFLKFCDYGRTNENLGRVKYTVEMFQQTHLNSFVTVGRRALKEAMPATTLKTHWEFLIAALNVFCSLNSLDIPEFFEDHSRDYFTVFLDILKFENPILTSPDEAGLLEQAKGIVCEAFTLYTDKYQEEFAPFLPGCVDAVWTLLVSVDLKEKFDQLVARGIKFLSSAASTRWQRSPFEDASIISKFCDKVILPNIVLRDVDVELFSENPLEYVRRDMESADQDTRRRSSMDLIKAMGKFNDAKVTEILLGYVKALLEQTRQESEVRAHRLKDACICLCIAMAVRGQTMRDGVTAVNPGVNVVDFFRNLIVPELTAGAGTPKKSILMASCLRFVSVFRSQLSLQDISTVFPSICKQIGSESAVVHTYSAICVEKLVCVRDRTPQGTSVLRYDAASLAPTLLQMIKPMLEIAGSGRGIPQNEYVMRSLSRIFAFLRQHGADVGLAALTPLGSIMAANMMNPGNPMFSHNLFECIAAIVKVCAPTQPEAVERVLLPQAAVVLEQNIVDYLPYAFQVLGLLLDATRDVKPLYQTLFTRVLDETLWKTQANIPGLIRLLRAYLTKHALCGPLLRSHLQDIFQRFAFVLSNRRTEGLAIEMVNSIYLTLPMDFYAQQFRTLLIALLQRLQTSKSPKYKRDLVTSCSLAIHRLPGGAFVKTIDSIQTGLLKNLLEVFWTPVCMMPLSHDERKICACAVAKLLACDFVQADAQLFRTLCMDIIQAVGLKAESAKSLKASAELMEDPLAGLLEDSLDGCEYEVSYSKLVSTDLPGAKSGLAADIPDLSSAVKELLRQQVQLSTKLVQLAAQDPELQPLVDFLR